MRCEIRGEAISPPSFNGIARTNRLFFVEESSSAREQSRFSKTESRGTHSRTLARSRVLFCNQRSSDPSRPSNAFSPEAIKVFGKNRNGRDDESVESFRRLVNSRNLERVRRQIIGVSICRNICRNIDIPRGTCCFVRISVVPTDSARALR